MISEGTGYVAEGCNEWNESISAAIQDYEDHVVPILERDKTFEMNCPVYDMNDNLC